MLTILSVGFSLALMTVLHGYLAMRGVWGKAAEESHRIVVMSTQGFSGQVPIAYVERVASTPGVVAATPYRWYGGHYKDEQFPFAQFGTNPKTVFQIWDDFTIAPDQLAEWQKTRSGCVVDRRLAEKRGWKIGERIPLKGTFFPFNLDLVLCGVWDSPRNTGSLWYNWEYLDEGLRQMNARGAGNAGIIYARLDRSEDMARVCQEFDDRFASSDNPTRSQTEAAFAQMFADMAGNVEAFIFNIGLAVVFSLSLVAANAMAMSMRERTTEIAVLKAIGFSRRRVLSMILGEACSITFLGGLLGIGIGCLSLQGLHVANSQMFPFTLAELLGPWVAMLMLTAAGIGLVSGFVPAVRAANLRVIDGLRRVV